MSLPCFADFFTVLRTALSQALEQIEYKSAPVISLINNSAILSIAKSLDNLNLFVIVCNIACFASVVVHGPA